MRFPADWGWEDSHGEKVRNKGSYVIGKEQDSKARQVASRGAGLANLVFIEMQSCAIAAEHEFILGL